MVRIFCVKKLGECPAPGKCATVRCDEKRPRQYQPDYEIEHTRSRIEVTPLGWCLGVFSILMFVIAAIRGA